MVEWFEFYVQNRGKTLYFFFFNLLKFQSKVQFIFLFLEKALFRLTDLAVQTFCFVMLGKRKNATGMAAI